MSDCIGAAEANFRQFGSAGDPVLDSMRAPRVKKEAFLPERANPVGVAKHFGFGHQIGGLIQRAKEVKEHPGVSLPGSDRASAPFPFGQGCVDCLLPTSPEPASGTGEDGVYWPLGRSGGPIGAGAGQEPVR